MATLRLLATTSPRVVASRAGVSRLPTATTANVISAGGSSRRTRRRQKAGSEKRPVVTTSSRISVPIKKPDSVKNNDTPR